jgi:hypothetical protein
MTIVNLALLWGHIPRGIIKCTRNICQRYERDVPFVLARDRNTGRHTTTSVHSLGSFHIATSVGPFPVSLVELVSLGPTSIPHYVIPILHTISLGFPIVGDSIYCRSEKFFNPVVSPPQDSMGLAIQDWYRIEGDQRILISPDSLSKRLLDGGHGSVSVCDSKLLPKESYKDFPGEFSCSNYTDHPEASHVRRDRGSC